MRQTTIIGLQYGDEGKGKITDALVNKLEVDIVARFNGGGNAGHSVEVGGLRRAVHQLPVGVFHEGVTSLMGTGMVIDPIKLRKEIEERLADSQSYLYPLIISDRAHLVTEIQVLRDGIQEDERDMPIGTTRTGNGPAYSDKADRSGYTIRQVLDGMTPLGASREWMDAVTRLAEYVRPAESIMDFSEGKRVLFEGAHGAMLDIDWGTYPYVTSSVCSAWAAPQGSGIPIDSHDHAVVGVAKAYLTRVAAGEFRTEIEDEAIADRIRTDGNEFGTTTGRPRRIGWLDLDELRWAARFNRCDMLALTLVDVLGDLDIVHVHSRNRRFRADMPGWSRDEVRDARYWSALPEELIEYISMIECKTSIPVTILSTGPDRDDLLMRGGWS